MSVDPVSENGNFSAPIRSIVVIYPLMPHLYGKSVLILDLRI